MSNHKCHYYLLYPTNHTNNIHSKQTNQQYSKELGILVLRRHKYPNTNSLTKNIIIKTKLQFLLFTYKTKVPN